MSSLVKNNPPRGGPQSWTTLTNHVVEGLHVIFIKSANRNAATTEKTREVRTQLELEKLLQGGLGNRYH